MSPSTCGLEVAAQVLGVACVVLSGLVSEGCDDFEEEDAGLPGDMPTYMTREERPKMNTQKTFGVELTVLCWRAMCL